MTTHQRTLQIRDAAQSSEAALAAAFNDVTAAIVAVGMLPVSSGDIAGQAGHFVVGTPTTGQTQVVGSTTANSFLLSGFNVFKHPTRELYVEVSYGQFVIGTSARYARFSFKVSSAISGGALDVLKRTPEIFPWSSVSTGSSPQIGTMPVAPKILYAACGDEYFWLFTESVFTTGSGSSSASHTYPVIPSPLAIAIFFPVDSSADDFVVIAPAEIAFTSTVPFGKALATTGPAAYRCWYFNGSLTRELEAGAAGYLINPISTLNDGVRVSQACVLGGGERLLFNFGHIGMTALSEGHTASIDIDGSGAQTYIYAPGFGPSTPSSYLATAVNISSIILPWS